MDPFKLLGLGASFEVDEQNLHRQFIRASAATHPDQYTDPFEQADAAGRSAEVNEAYAILKDPERRANVLLTLLGGPGKADDKSLPPELLMQMMERRESLEQAVAENDQAASVRLGQWAQDERAARIRRIAELFGQAQSVLRAEERDRDKLLKQIRLELNALRYIERMIEQTPD